MSRTNNYRKQHAELLEIAYSLKPYLRDKGKLIREASDVRAQLSRLFGKLNMHLAMEDRSLYPSLQESSDPKVRETGRRFQEEMGPIGTVVHAYGRRWTVAKISETPRDFAKETQEIM